MANAVKGRQLQELKDSILVTVRGPMDGISGSHLCCSQCRKLGGVTRGMGACSSCSQIRKEEAREGERKGGKTGNT